MPPKPKTILDKVLVAIEDLKSPTGSSRQALAKYLKEHFEHDNPSALKRALDKAVSDGRLEQRGQSYLVPGVTYDAPEEERVEIEVLSEGFEESGRCEKGDQVCVTYVGRLKATGEVFERSRGPFRFTLGYGEVIKGWEEGVLGMKVDETRRLTIPPKLAYGKRGSPPEIPEDATLVFEMTMLRFEPVV